MTNKPENQNANKLSMDLISRHLQVITDELQEMRERENGKN